MRDDVASLFDAMASSYDTLEPWYEHLYAVLHGIVRAESRPTPGAPRRALDAGCGNGFQTAILEALGHRPHGIDVSAGLLSVAASRLPGCAFARADVEALPYGDGVFDVATCCGSTLSLVSSADVAIRELARVLRPGGRLLLECEHRPSLDLAWALASSLTGDALGYRVSRADAWRAIRAARDARVTLDYPCALPDDPSASMELRLFTRAELDRMLTAVGLRAVKTWGIHAITNLIPSTVLHRERLPSGLGALYRALCAVDRRAARAAASRCLANSLVVLAEKPAV